MIPERLVQPAATWADLRAAFRWPALAEFNIAEAACTRWARRDPKRIALYHVAQDGTVEPWTYGALENASARLAAGLAALGLGPRDRIAILLAQGPETVIAHLATYRLGAIALPLFTLFGADGLDVRLRDAGARAVVTDAQNLEKIGEIRAGLPKLDLVLSIDGPEPGVLGVAETIAASRPLSKCAATGPDDPALLAYTSGTTGPPKGALHGHRVLLGHLPGFELPHEFLPRPGDLFWTPADWAWLGGLMNAMLPALTLGVPLVAHRPVRFDPEGAWALISRLGIRNVFLPPTALKLMRQSAPAERPGLRTVASGGEALGAEMLAWGQEALGLTINEFYGQTECNLVLANAASIGPVKPGSMGRPVPGHDVAVIDSDGNRCRPGETGEVAIRRPSPAMFLEYWGQPEKTREKFIGDWMRTGDEASVDEDGFFTFSARSDDVITSAGYRIGPAEIEDCLTAHPAVALAAVIGVPDPARTESIRAHVVAAAPVAAEALIEHVRSRLSPHMAPREIVFDESLPMTASGKILRRALRQGDRR
ncbi:MAG: AMP-binding protein [Pseudomonadota bacterium]